MASFETITDKARFFRSRGSKIVAIQGLGFVGTAVAAVVAHATGASGEPLYYVIGVDLPTPQGRWKVEQINKGMSPIVSADAELAALVEEGACKRGNLSATVEPKSYSLADVIVIDIPLDVKNRFAFDPQDVEIDLEPFKDSIRIIGRWMRPDALVLVETTVPIGTCEKVIQPILEEERSKRGVKEPLCLAHAYERVMPGPNYVASIRQCPRTFSGIDAASARRAREFLATFIDAASYPLHELEDPSSSELAKLMENSYRAVNIAWIHEWTLLAEKMGINLFRVIESIRVRKGTHDNMKNPGFGVGGYCLTKDSLLAQWSCKEFSAEGLVLKMTLDALRTNAEMPLHTFKLLAEVSQNNLKGKSILICGLSYLAEVSDTRNSPTETLYDALVKAGAHVVIHDPYVRQWAERPNVAPSQDLGACLREGVQGIIFAVPHRSYGALHPSAISDSVAKPPFIVDAQNIISDEKAGFLVEAGCRLAGVGKGHWRKKGYHCQK